MWGCVLGKRLLQVQRVLNSEFSFSAAPVRQKAEGYFVWSIEWFGLV